MREKTKKAKMGPKTSGRTNTTSKEESEKPKATNREGRKKGIEGQKIRSDLKREATNE